MIGKRASSISSPSPSTPSSTSTSTQHHRTPSSQRSTSKIPPPAPNQYPPNPYPANPTSSTSTPSTPRKSSTSSDSTSTTSTRRSSDRGYHTSVSTVPLSPLSEASFRSAESSPGSSSRNSNLNGSLSGRGGGVEGGGEAGEGRGARTPTVRSVGMPGVGVGELEDVFTRTMNEKVRSSDSTSINSNTNSKDQDQDQEEDVKLPMTPNSVGARSPALPPLPSSPSPSRQSIPRIGTDSISSYVLPPPPSLPSIPGAPSTIPYLPTIPTIPPLSRPTSIQSRLGLSNATGFSGGGGIGVGVGGVGGSGNVGVGGGGGGNAEDREVVDELLGTMKQMLGTLGATFDTLGEQTVKVATLPAAMEAVSQISSVRKQLDDQHKRQEQRMQDMKTLLLEEVRTKLYSRLRETASEIVREVVQREIAERVRVQLQEQIPKKLREDVVSYKRQIMEVKVSLHNSEARRHNALIRANSLDEPLMPLLRPPPLPRSEWAGNGNAPLQVTIPGPHTAGVLGGAVSAYTDKTPTALPLTARVFSESASHSRSNSRSAVNPKSTRLLPKLEMPVQPLTPSPLFPRDLTSLIRLGTEEARALMREYGLVRVRYPEKSKLADVGEAEEGDGLVEGQEKQEGGKESEEVVEVVEEEESREESINRFLAYIGVGFQLVSSPDAPTGAVNLTKVK